MVTSPSKPQPLKVSETSTFTTDAKTSEYGITRTITVYGNDVKTKKSLKSSEKRAPSPLASAIPTVNNTRVNQIRSISEQNHSTPMHIQTIPVLSRHVPVHHQSASDAMYSTNQVTQIPTFYPTQHPIQTINSNHVMVTPYNTLQAIPSYQSFQSMGQHVQVQMSRHNSMHNMHSVRSHSEGSSLKRPHSPIQPEHVPIHSKLFSPQRSSAIGTGRSGAELTDSPSNIRTIPMLKDNIKLKTKIGNHSNHR
uniref:Uncharacterized protein n=1 Tax=Ciona savignyi TaxID=51511 RepID=H2ZD17_CIOSA